MNLRKLLVGLAAIGLAAGAGAIVVRQGGLTHAAGTNAAADGGADAADESRVTVRTVRPKKDPNFRIFNEQVAVVEPFYQAGVRARACGVVRAVPKEIGESVRAGELLVEIDSPDLVADVEQKEAVIRQRRQELRVSRALLKLAEAAVETAKSAVAQRQAECKQADATRDYKHSYLEQVSGLLADKTIPAVVVYQHKMDYLASEAACEAAREAIHKAKADQLEKQASLEAARADVDLKAAHVEVAVKDRDVAAAKADFARLTAPFDGVITKRSVDPGMFVQNATTGPTEALVTLARIDLVTVVMKLPDAAAPYISLDTDVEVSFLDRPELKLHGRVTRFSPVIDGQDKNMRVEVDVFNGPRSEFEQFLSQTYAEVIAPLGPGNGIGAAAAALAADRHRQLFHKGVSENLAVCPEVATGSRARPIVPGMTARMKVYLDRVSAAYLLPASAVYASGGLNYILLVQNGRTRQVPVRVQVNDGRMAKVALLPRPGEMGAGFRDLTGAEEVVLSRQLEVGDGVRVKTVPGDW
ncbi:MAG TPA: efflux RND transporter periplasmic adaptor subunit [Gemmataceae bacterium]|nr:efflux RND transporter periplasmic adaptor subunit [Gemmataceae bacterium]